MRKRNSLTFRLTLLFATASTAVLLALGYMIGDAVEKHFEELDMVQIAGKMKLAKNVLLKLHSRDDLIILKQKLDDSLIGHHGLALAIFDPTGKIFFATNGIEFPQPLFDLVSNAKAGASAQWTQDEKTFRWISETVPINVPEWPTALVIVAKDASQHQHFMSAFHTTLWWFVAMAALLMGLLGWISARRGLAPLREMKNNVAEVSASRLTQRLASDRFPAELADLGETFNEMLFRLENSFARLTNFSSDIAHELRTPVSNLMTQTQVVLSRARTVEEYYEILASNAEELERMSRMISDMLYLAKADNNSLLPDIEPIFLAQEFHELLEFYEALTEEKEVKLRIDGDAEILGNKLMLRRAFSNLLSNAIRHTQTGGEVSIAITGTNKQIIRVDVCNPGSISEEHLPHLFERFYRVDPSRQRNGEGTGLGLAITKSIIEAHHGSIDVKSDNGLVRFALLFKRTS